MKLNVRTIMKNSQNNREVVERLVEKNIHIKLDSYLVRYRYPGMEGDIVCTVEENKKGNFAGTLSARLNADRFYYSREDFKNLDDLVNHLFDHLKYSLSTRREKEAVLVRR